LFAPVWHAYRENLIFAAALIPYLAVSGLCVVASDTWGELLTLPGLGALPFLFAPALARFRGLFVSLVVGGVGVLVGGELLFRASYFGSDALLRVTSYSPMPVTALPRLWSPSADPDLGPILRPGATAMVNGETWEINDTGFRDRPFEPAKEPGRYRILVLGDSFVLGVGVALEDRFSSRLEEQIGGRVEVYNLGLAGLGLERLGRQMEVAGPRYDADLILVAVRASELHSKERVWDPRAPQPRVGTRSSTFSFVRRYSFVLNIQRDPVRIGLNRVVSYLPTFGDQPAEVAPSEDEVGAFERLIERCAAYTRRHGRPVVVAALRKMEFRTDVGLRATLARRVLRGDLVRESDHIGVERVTAAFGVPYIDTYDYFDPDSRRGDYIIYPGDGHPNARGHDQYAKAIVSWLRDQGYPPASPGG